MRIARGTLALAMTFAAQALSAAVFIYVPVVTQVQGVAQYRTSLAVSNIGAAADVAYTLAYRSPVDGTMQYPVLLSDVPANGAFATDDFIQYMKAKGAIRTADLPAALFGSLEVQVTSTNDPTEISVVARTYSPTAGGGTVGLSYVGRAYGTCGAALARVVTTVRNGAFGEDGNSRANIGFVSEGNTPMDLHITYIDAATHATLKSFDLSGAAGHLLASREVVQLNNIFADPALAGVARIIITATTSPAQTFTAYAVQLDNTTNDGSFFLLTEK